MFKNFNKLEKSWIYYDIGNSAFTMMVSTIIPIWFNTLAANAGMSNSEYLAYWSYATSIATILVAIVGPIFGSIADNKDFKKPMFMFVLFVGVIGCALLGAVPNWILYLITYVIAKVCYQTSLVFYDSMLTDVTTPERMDLVSSQGYAWGYIGSCIPFVIALGLYAAGNPDFLGIMNEKLSIFLAFIVIAVWWFCVTIPLLKNYTQKYYVETTSNKVKESISRLGKTLVTMYRDEKKVFFFLLAFFFYIDGVYTIIDMATAYGTSLGLNTTGLLLALLLTQIVAFPASLTFAVLSKTKNTASLIKVAIIAYFLIALFAVQLDKQWEFWVLAVAVGCFQGGIQALSRSYFAKIIPENASGEYFGLFDICGKGASFLGTMLIGVVTQITGKQNLGVAAISIMFVVGYLIFNKVSKIDD